MICVGTVTVAITVSSEGDAFLDADIDQPQRVAHLHRADIDLDPLRHLERQRLDVDLARDL
jgi:hypothetical protein